MPRLLFGLLGLLLLAGVGLAAPKVEADPNKEYQIAPEAGPWLISAASFTCPKADEMARELVLIIRRDYQMPAYLFIKGRKEREEQLQRYREFKAKYPDAPFRHEHIDEQFAVLVGGFKDSDAAHNALVDFKKLAPPPAKFCDISTIQEAGTQNGQKGVWTKEVRLSPFARAFVIHNPTIPLEREADPREEKFLRDINSGESLSLLNCRKPWTLAIKVFQGAQMVQQKASSSTFLDKLGLGNKEGQQLNAAGLQAHELANALRSMKVMKDMKLQAYVLHTRTSSVVTVGGYDAADDPKLIHDQQFLSKLQLQAGANAKQADVHLLSQPLPMPVPRP